jgi:AraC-like DNA-binding protein
MKAELEPIVSGQGESFYARRFDQEAFDHPLHFHPEPELVFIERSSGSLMVGDYIGSFAAGECYLLGANLPHIFSQTSPPQSGAAAEVLHFRAGPGGEPLFVGAEWGALIDLLERAQGGLVFDAATSARAREWMTALRKSCGLARWANFIELAKCLTEVEPLRNLVSPGYSNALISMRSDRMERVCQYLLQHFKEDLSHREVAQRFHLAPASFSRLFKKATRKTFQNFVNELRLGHACRQLGQSDATITEIAFASGFSNLSNFNRRFKEIYGCSPSAYRKQTS